MQGIRLKIQNQKVAMAKNETSGGEVRVGDLRKMKRLPDTYVYSTSSINTGAIFFTIKVMENLLFGGKRD